MTGELGQLALCLALALTLVQCVTGFWGGARDHVRLMAASRSSALGVFVFSGLAFFTLMYAYVTSDFSITVVANNSHTLKPLLYKITGVWGNHEGSMLLWLLILSTYSAAMAITGSGGLRLCARALGVQALVALAFLLFILLTSNPFLRLYPPPFEGAGLNPLLQDPGLAFHPPLLYLGYVGLSAAFSYAVAALVEARNDAAWVTAARPFALVAWTALTLGIAAGSWWAYYELGWGGFWFWDPVENASLMPWLVATALIHSLMATERTGAFKSWTLLLAVMAFAFSLIGTFLVRSGVLTSVHAFANDPARGRFILMILGAAIGAPLALFAWRAPKLSPGAPFEPVSRDTGILLNNLLLTTAAATVFVGTIYPLALDALEGTKISVGPPYFSLTFTPIMAAAAILMPFGPLIGWTKGDLSAAWRLLRVAFAIAVLAVIGTAVFVSPRSALGLFAIGMGTWLMAGSITDLVRRARASNQGFLRGLRALPIAAWSVILAHGGLGVTAYGVAGASVWRTEVLAAVAPGDTLNIAGHTLRFDGVKEVHGPNYIAQRATVTVLVDGEVEHVMYPEKRAYPAEQQTVTDTAIETNGFHDLYLALGDSRGDGLYALSAYVNPLAPFIWFGAIIMALGGACAVGARLSRVRREARAAAPALA